VGSRREGCTYPAAKWVAPIRALLRDTIKTRVLLDQPELGVFDEPNLYDSVNALPSTRSSHRSYFFETEGASQYHYEEIENLWRGTSGKLLQAWTIGKEVGERLVEELIRA
jgi:hypothetical protein